MAPSLGLLAATLLQLAVANSVPPSAEPQVQIDASGTIHAHGSQESSKNSQLDGLLNMMKQAKEKIHNTRKTSQIIRTEVRRHLPEALEQVAAGETSTGNEAALRRQRFEQVLGLLEVGEVNCSESSIATDEVTSKLCRVLAGTNLQVAGKLERAVKGLSLRPKSPNATEMVVADKDDEGLLKHLKAAMWDLWFCAKRAEPPCDPNDMNDPKVKAAREQAFDALHAIHNHAQADETSAKKEASDIEQSKVDETIGASATQSLSQAHPNRRETEEHNVPNRQVKAYPHMQDSSSILQEVMGQEPVAPATEFATNTMDGILTPPNVTGKLWDAINMIDIDETLSSDIIKVTSDEDGNMKKLKSNMLLLHECASMPDCPAENCCTPKNPTQAVYIQARNDAYVAYHEIQHDDDLAKQAYLDLLQNIGGGKKKKAKKGKYYPPGHPLHKSTTIYPPGHPLHGTEGQNNTNETVSAPAPPVEEGSILLYAIIAVTAVVVLAVGFLVVKTMQMDGKDSAQGGGAEQWGAEGYGGGEGYGQY